MTPITKLSALACPLMVENVDTDQLIPARFMKRPRTQGYGDALLYDLRRDGAGALREDFALNQPRWQGAGILIAGRNFGGGSSREAAVYALVDHGTRCVIAPSLGDIFQGNAVNNGLLPIALPQADCERLAALVMQGNGQLGIDLERQVITAGVTEVAFHIDPVWRMKLLNGWDDIGLTASHAEAIAAFQQQDAIARPWAQPRLNTEGTRS